ncbi:hypothetical protein QYF36_026999 [Acer negundo]|nr:hypothetical protein QYF36_026999 [Acer negundo]
MASSLRSPQGRLYHAKMIWRNRDDSDPRASSLNSTQGHHYKAKLHPKSQKDSEHRAISPRSPQARLSNIEDQSDLRDGDGGFQYEIMVLKRPHSFTLSGEPIVTDVNEMAPYIVLNHPAPT